METNFSDENVTKIFDHYTQQFLTMPYALHTIVLPSITFANKFSLQFPDSLRGVMRGKIGHGIDKPAGVPWHVLQIRWRL